MTTLRLILGDQLSDRISSLMDCDKATDIVLMAEVWDEATYVRHHKKKIAFLFSAMRHHAQRLEQNGYRVSYTQLDDQDNAGSLLGEIKRMIEHLADNNPVTRVVVTSPGEYRLLHQMHEWSEQLQIPVEIREDNRFLSSTEDFANWAADRKQLRMEFFYRDMRKRYRVLMDGDQPLGGKWNYDADNRKPAKTGLTVPKPYQQDIDQISKDVIEMVGRRFADHFGDLEPFYFAVTREQALAALDLFVQSRLAMFGDYQDAMLQNEPWMFHSHISFYLNCGLLEPMECIETAQDAYFQGDAPLNAVEGFIRQILGWREYVRGIYWLKMPGYASENYFQANRQLPDFYWSGETEMNCLSQCVSETRQNAYAHHIQRLMVLGNFALIAGVDPEQVNEWFLIVYADAYEWVELPNVSGMILFADGGYLASKPYAAGGAYINKMSDYCKSCRYKVSVKNGADACPFNYLYWDFLARNRNHLKNNHRLSMIYRTYDRMTDEKKELIAGDSAVFFRSLKAGD